MSVSIIILTDESSNKEKIKNYWTPVKLKYKDRPEIEFIIIENINLGIQRAKYNTVFITPWNMIPTYKALLAIEKLTPNQCLISWIHGEHDISANTFSINKNLYKGESISEWSDREDVKIIETTMYKV